MKNAQEVAVVAAVAVAEVPTAVTAALRFGVV